MNLPKCRECSTPLDPKLDAEHPEGRSPCPSCGSTARYIPADAGETLEIGELNRQAKALQIEFKRAEDRLREQFFGIDSSLVRKLQLEDLAQRFDLPAKRVLKDLGALNELLSPSLVEMAKLHAAQQFRNPAAGEIGRLLGQLNRNPVADLMKDFDGSSQRLKTALESIRSPFLELDSVTKSLAAAAEIHSIGEAIAARQPYDRAISRALRQDLGDWRDSIDWTRFELEDVTSRIELYVDRGFDVGVVDIPDEAFDEVLDRSGLTSSPPTLVDQFGLPIDLPQDVDESELERTSRACHYLVRFENSLRSFISGAMTRAYGEGWEKKRVPPDVIELWVERQEAARHSGMRVFPLIAYADFTEYEKVICRKDNWREVFQPFFLRRENVQESFQRLYPVRVAAMHSRMLTPEDEMFLFVEIRRMGKALRT